LYFDVEIYVVFTEKKAGIIKYISIHKTESNAKYQRKQKGGFL